MTLETCIVVGMGGGLGRDEAVGEMLEFREQYEEVNPSPTQYMGKHPIDLTRGNLPLLNPHQFSYPLRTGQPVVEVELYQFQKVIIQLRCTGPDTIYIFYENIRHIADSFNSSKLLKLPESVKLHL